MRKAREMVKEMMSGKKEKHEYDEDEKMVEKHLKRDIRESKKSIEEDKKLKKALREEED